MTEDAEKEGKVKQHALEEFKTLRNEILQTIEAQYRILISGTPIVSAFLGLGFTLLGFGQEGTLLASAGVFGIASLLALALLALWMAEETRRIRANLYIMKELEEPLKLGWESFVRKSHEDLKMKYGNIYGLAAFKEHYSLLQAGTFYVLVSFSVLSVILANVVLIIPAWFGMSSYVPPQYVALILGIIDPLWVTSFFYSPGWLRKFRIFIKEERRLGIRIPED